MSKKARKIGAAESQSEDWVQKGVRAKYFWGQYLLFVDDNADEDEEDRPVWPESLTLDLFRGFSGYLLDEAIHHRTSGPLSSSYILDVVSLVQTRLKEKYPDAQIWKDIEKYSKNNRGACPITKMRNQIETERAKAAIHDGRPPLGKAVALSYEEVLDLCEAIMGAPTTAFAWHESSLARALISMSFQCVGRGGEVGLTTFKEMEMSMPQKCLVLKWPEPKTGDYDIITLHPSRHVALCPVHALAVYFLMGTWIKDAANSPNGAADCPFLFPAVAKLAHPADKVSEYMKKGQICCKGGMLKDLLDRRKTISSHGLRNGAVNELGACQHVPLLATILRGGWKFKNENQVFEYQTQEVKLLALAGRALAGEQDDPRPVVWFPLLQPIRQKLALESSSTLANFELWVKDCMCDCPPLPLEFIELMVAVLLRHYAWVSTHFSSNHYSIKRLIDKGRAYAFDHNTYLVWGQTINEQFELDNAPKTRPGGEYTDVIAALQRRQNGQDSTLNRLVALVGTMHNTMESQRSELQQLTPLLQQLTPLLPLLESFLQSDVGKKRPRDSGQVAVAGAGAGGCSAVASAGAGGCSAAPEPAKTQSPSQQRDTDSALRELERESRAANGGGVRLQSDTNPARELKYDAITTPSLSMVSRALLLTLIPWPNSLPLPPLLLPLQFFRDMHDKDCHLHVANFGGFANDVTNKNGTRNKALYVFNIMQRMMSESEKKVVESKPEKPKTGQVMTVYNDWLFGNTNIVGVSTIGRRIESELLNWAKAGAVRDRKQTLNTIYDKLTNRSAENQPRMAALSALLKDSSQPMLPDVPDPSPEAGDDQQSKVESRAEWDSEL